MVNALLAGFFYFFVLFLGSVILFHSFNYSGLKPYFWSSVAAAIILEAGLLAWKAKTKIFVSLMIATVVNLISFCWLHLWGAGMMSWETGAGDRKIYLNLNHAPEISVFWLLAGISGAWIEAFSARVLWKHSIKKVFLIFLLGNILYYGVTAVAAINAQTCKPKSERFLR